MKCIMHKCLCLKNSKLEKLFEVSVIYSVNSLCFYQHSAQHAVKDRNSALESAKSISPYISLLSTHRRILTLRKDPSCQIHLRGSRVGGQGVVREPQRSPKVQPQTLGSQDAVQATSSLLLRSTLRSTPHPAAQALGLVGAPRGWQEHPSPSKAPQG